MTRSGTWLASVAVIALTAGITSRADVPTEPVRPLPPGSFMVAAENTGADLGQTEESAQDSGKMGKEEGSQEGAELGTPPESDSDKIDQPRDRTAESVTGEEDGTPQ